MLLYTMFVINTESPWLDTCLCDRRWLFYEEEKEATPRVCI